MSNAFFQNSFYIGNNFNWVLYGVNLVLYVQTMHIYTTSRSPHKRSTFFMCFSTIMLVLITIFVAVQSIFGQEMWIINADYPGGSAAYLATYAAVGYHWQTTGVAASVILQLMSDGLLIYRCAVVWQDRKIIILPCFLWLAALVFGILSIYISGSPNADFFQLSAHVTVTYVAICIGLNFMLTSFICGRLLYYAHRSRRQFGSAIAQTYFSIAGIIVESALPYTLSGIAYVVSTGLYSDIATLFLSLYTMITCLSPQMLILRVATGRAWDVETATRTGVTLMQHEVYTGHTMIIGATTIHLGSMMKSTLSRDDE